MYKINYTHRNLQTNTPAAAVCLLEHHVHPNYCFSSMAFETFNDAMDAIAEIVNCIEEHARMQEKKMHPKERYMRLSYRTIKGKDGKSVTLQYFVTCWENLATWTVCENMAGSSRAMIVFLDKDGFRCTYEFDSLAEMFDCIKKDKYLAANKEILLVADEGIPIYSSLAFQPDIIPGKERNQAHIRVVFRGEDGVRQTVECDSVEDFFHCVQTTDQLNDKAEILLAATNGTLAYSSLERGGLKKRAGLNEIMDWFAPVKKD